MADVTLTVDGKATHGARGHAADRCLPGGRHRDSCVLLLPRALAAGRLPHVPGAHREDAEAADRLHHSRRRRHGCRTETPEIAQARKATLELLLTNHPLDCPVCDKGGECELQDMMFRYGAGESLLHRSRSSTAMNSSGRRWCSSTRRAAFSAIAACASAARAWTCGRSACRIAASSSEIAPNRRRSPGLRRVRHVHRHLPGRRADQRHLSLQDAAVGDEPRRHHLHPLRRRLQDDARRAQRDDGEIIRGNNRDKSGINGEFLCIKGRYAFDFANHPERLTKPLVRKPTAS